MQLFVIKLEYKAVFWVKTSSKQNIGNFLLNKEQLPGNEGPKSRWDFKFNLNFLIEKETQTHLVLWDA